MDESDRLRVLWDALSTAVADSMKVYTRPYVNILAGDVEIGTGTFIEVDAASIITCEHVARFDPTAYFVDFDGVSSLNPGDWRLEPDINKDVAVAAVSPEEWSKISRSARFLSTSKLASHHAPVANELLFFRGIAGENARYVGNFGADVILSGYCSQERPDSGDSNMFEILWFPEKTKVTSGTSDEVRDRVQYKNPGVLSGSLVWNTRFVEMGCDFSRWSPDQAVVTGLLRRYDEETDTLLAWRVEHLQAWL